MINRFKVYLVVFCIFTLQNCVSYWIREELKDTKKIQTMNQFKELHMEFDFKFSETFVTITPKLESKLFEKNKYVQIFHVHKTISDADGYYNVDDKGFGTPINISDKNSYLKDRRTSKFDYWSYHLLACLLIFRIPDVVINWTLLPLLTIDSDRESELIKDDLIQKKKEEVKSIIVSLENQYDPSKSPKEYKFDKVIKIPVTEFGGYYKGFQLITVKAESNLADNNRFLETQVNINEFRDDPEYQRLYSLEKKQFLSHCVSNYANLYKNWRYYDRLGNSNNSDAVIASYCTNKSNIGIEQFNLCKESTSRCMELLNAE